MSQSPPSNTENDTFLSRVFGLNSVYNQVQNFPYYDPDTFGDSQMSPNHSNIIREASPIRNQDPFAAQEAGPDIESLLLLGHLEEDDPSRLKLPKPTFVAPPNNEDHGRRWIDSEPDDLDNSSDESGVPDDAVLLPHNLIRLQNLGGAPPSAENGRAEASESSRPPTAFKIKIKEPALPLFHKRNPPNDLEQGLNSENPDTQRIYFGRGRGGGRGRVLVIPPRERALYLWANITNMDDFLVDLYYYFLGKGLVNIILSRVIDLLILMFVLSLTTFLTWGIDYSSITGFATNGGGSDVSHSPGATAGIIRSVTLKDIVIQNWFHDMVPASIKVALFGFSVYLVLRFVQLFFDYRFKLKEIRNFYQFLLGIDDEQELMTISWTTIVERLILLKDYNSLTSFAGHNFNERGGNFNNNDLSSKVRLNAHDIANRIMRKENYMIAMINKDILDMCPIDFPPAMRKYLNNTNVLTKTLEWNLKLCINNFAFNQHGQIQPRILKDYNRNQLASELSSRFKMAAIISLILSPFITVYFVLLYFFKYFNEYKTNPINLSNLRQFTPYSEWKLREFNELHHFFIKRLRLSMGPSMTYINQFPKSYLVLNVMYLINFISGSLLAVLVITGIFVDDEGHSFWSFELTSGRSALFYISILGTVWAVTNTQTANVTAASSFANVTYNNTANEMEARQGDSPMVYDPEAQLRYVSQFTHYLPKKWLGKLHTVQVRNEYCSLFSLQIYIIFMEILSVILTPWILWFKISQCLGSIVDFFREYSVHVDGLGYVCYFAMFNFEEKDKNIMYEQKKKRKNRKQAKQQTKQQQQRKQKRKLRQSDDINRDDFSESSDDPNDSDMNYYQDDKMIKSYMHFLESYGTSKPGNATTTNVIPTKNTTPSTTTKNNQPFTSKSQGAAPVRRPYATIDDDAMTSSMYNFDEGFPPDEDDDDTGTGPHRKGKSGVLGMINQFYKNDYRT
ncbi:autophagy protein atg9 [Scheffersomyces spartinae]|uniref:Autophagy-related protein 9 n=1 Tax=Scheffersomyces spartinae TaxID=45513 RepID=A0A9P7V956_9ASCO|nr:autophagy protein atg9 [Scheffersomyces spartinae]KAG7193504.1 autophagy protein atg9 [Scheffersomyces spartinae]